MRLILSFFSLFIFLTPMAQKGLTPGKYPATTKSSQVDSFFGTAVSDPYRWLENNEDSNTHQWIESQNKTTGDYLSNIPFINSIRQRVTELWNYEKFGAPFKEGNYIYYYKNDGLQNQFVVYRHKVVGGETEVFLDPNLFSKDATTSLAGLEFTKDGSLCAYQISEGGSDWRKVIVVDAATKKQLGDTLYDVKFSGISWRKNDGFYYSSYEKPAEGNQLSGKTEQHRLYYHKLGTAQSEDSLVFGGSTTPRRYISGRVTEDEKYLVISASNATYGNELYIQSLAVPGAVIKPVVTGFETEQDIFFSNDNKLYIITDFNAPNRKVVVTPASRPEKANWKDLISETSFPLDVSTGGMKIFTQYIKDAVSQVHQYNLDGKKEKTIELPGLGSASGFNGKREETTIYYSYYSYIHPSTIFKYEISSGKSAVYKKPEVKFDPTAFESRQVFYASKDGTKVPMIITFKKGTSLNGKNPLMLYGYGGFNVSLTPSFSVANLVFMENGGIYAVANLRGGGEYGANWHTAGTKMNKQNVFDDFFAAAEYLIKEKYTSKNYLAISGGSNGGLLVGACMNQRPDLFRVCFPAVGVMDMLRYHQFTAGAGWSYDYGTANDSKEMFEYLFKYSPVHNLSKGTCYPSTMVTTADHDDRVVPAHSFKFAAALQAAQGCNNPVLIRVETKAGHGAGKPTGMIINEVAEKWAFMLYEMGLTYTPPSGNGKGQTAESKKQEQKSTKNNL